MAETISVFLAAPAAVLIATAAIVTRSTADAKPERMRRWVSGVATLQLAFAGVASLVYLYRMLSVSAADAPLAVSLPSGVAPALSIYFDGVSSLMFLMVSFVGWVICRYSIRYLDGDPSQGNYFRWTGFTLGAVALMVVSGNLLLFFACWLMTSTGLHHLLLHDPSRAPARRAAWTKFTVSRVGDGALAVSLIMLYRELGTLDLASLFASVATIEQASVNLQVASFLLVAAAAIKSAQFPVHTWLPQTLETPTPVSALMHAGIVNAGGYLIVRTSPIVSVAPWALAVLAVIGATTACFAAIVMLTQTSVKKSLAYSTIAQMGFMLLQCGLGAFSAALLHILAHSMYKAHAFLSSGSVIAGITTTGKPQSEPLVDPSRSGSIQGWLSGLSALAITVLLLLVSMLAVGIDPTQKAGGLVLGSILCVAVARWLSGALATGDRLLALRAVAIAGGLCLTYSTSFKIVDVFASPSVPVPVMPSAAWIAACSIIAGGFTAVFLIDRGSLFASSGQWGRRFYVHASNGFYVESMLRSVFGSLSKS